MKSLDMLIDEQKLDISNIDEEDDDIQNYLIPLNEADENLLKDFQSRGRNDVLNMQT